MISTLVAFVIVTIVIGVFAHNEAMNNLLELGERNNEALTQSFANSLWPEFQSFLDIAADIPPDELLQQPQIADLRTSVLNQMRGLSVVKLKLYSLSGVTVFSTDLTQIGDEKEGNAGFVSARNGDTISHLTHRDTFSTFEGMVENRDLISSYIPIRIDGQIKAVLEVYDDVTPVLQHMEATGIQVGAIVTLTLHGLYIFLVLLVRHVDRLVRRYVAERRQTLDELAQARDQALTASRLKSQILANVSHDARNPLNVITMRVDMMRRGVYGPTTSKQDEALDGLMDQAQHLLEFISNLLDQSQIEAGGFKVKSVNFETRRLVDYLAATLRPLAEDKGLTFSCEVTDDIPAQLMGDPERLEQILSNLTGNAIKFTQAGEICVRIYSPDEQHWAMSVTDTGPGIRQEMHPHLFEAFWQSNDARNMGNGRGVGLGLSIVHKITAAMSGKIEVQSEVGCGSTFIVTLPLVTETVGSPA